MASRLIVSSRTRQMGVSLLIALIAVLIVGSVMASVALTTHYTLKRGETITHLTQSQAYNHGVLLLAKQLLILDGHQNDYDGLNELWAQRLPGFTVEGGVVNGYITELNSRFNLAGLHVDNPFEQAVFRRLWSLLDADTQRSEQLITLAKSQKYFSVIGLFTAAGINEVELNRLAPYFTYLPTNANQLNINCVSAPVLAAYLNLGLGQAEQLIAPLKTAPLSSQTALRRFAKQHQIAEIGTSALDPTSTSVIELRFGIKSRYFQVVSITTLGTASAVSLYTLDRNGQSLNLLSQRLNKLVTE